MESVPTRLILSRLCEDYNKTQKSLEFRYKKMAEGGHVEDYITQYVRGEREVIAKYMEEFAELVNAELIFLPKKESFGEVDCVRWRWKKV